MCNLYILQKGYLLSLIINAGFLLVATHDKLLEYIKKTDIKYYKKIIKKKDKCNIKRKK